MITNLYKEVLKAHQEGSDYQGISVMLTDANVLVFGGLYRLFNDNALKVLLYIFHAYSEGSPKLLIGADSEKNKRDILDSLSMPVEVAKDILSYENDDLNNIIINYLEFQGAAEFMHLKMAEDMYGKLMASTYLSMSAKGEESKEFDQKKFTDNYKILTDMRDQKNKLKDELKEKYAYVYENVEEIGAKSKKRRLNANMENSTELKRI